jgi:hypothetical protein
MDRREFLWVVGGVALAGCADGGDGETATGPTATDTEEGDFEFKSGGEFEIVAVDHPEQVRVDESHTVDITVENVGEERGTFGATLQWTFADEDEWREVTQYMAVLDPDETTVVKAAKWLSYDRAGEVQLRVQGYEGTWSYGVEGKKTDTPADIDVAVESASLRAVETTWASDPMPGVDVTLTNRGETTTSMFGLTIEWFDGDGANIGTTEDFAPPLAGGETARIRVIPLGDFEGDNYRHIEDFELTVESAEPIETVDPDGIIVVDEQLVRTEGETSLRVRVRNERDSQPGLLSVYAKFMDSSGTVIGWDWRTAAMTDFPPGETVELELEPDRGVSDDAVAAYDLLVVDESLSMDG